MIADLQAVYCAILGRYFRRVSSATFTLVVRMSRRCKRCARHLVIDPTSSNTAGTVMRGSSAHLCLPESRIAVELERNRDKSTKVALLPHLNQCQYANCVA